MFLPNLRDIPSARYMPAGTARDDGLVQRLTRLTNHFHAYVLRYRDACPARTDNLGSCGICGGGSSGEDGFGIAGDSLA